MKKLKELLLVILLFAMPVIGGIVAEIIAKIITMDFIVTIAYISIPVLIVLLIKTK